MSSNAQSKQFLFQVSVVCRDRLTSVYSEVKNATFWSQDSAVATPESGYSDGEYEAVYYRTYDICFRPSLSPIELFSGDVYVHYIGVTI